MDGWKAIIKSSPFYPRLPSKIQRINFNYNIRLSRGSMGEGVRGNKEKAEAGKGREKVKRGEGEGEESVNGQGLKKENGGWK